MLSRVGLNFFYHAQVQALVPTNVLVIRRDVGFRLLKNLLLVLDQTLSAEQIPRVRGAFAEATRRHAFSLYRVLRAQGVDLLEDGRLLDPLPAPSRTAAVALEDPEVLFFDTSLLPPRHLDPEPRFAAEYARLAKRQLRSGNVVLDTTDCCSARTFCIGKKGKDAQREIWSGDKITNVAIPPLKPPLQANPICPS